VSSSFLSGTEDLTVKCTNMANICGHRTLTTCVVIDRFQEKYDQSQLLLV
jgi:hypothetical protein